MGSYKGFDDLQIHDRENSKANYFIGGGNLADRMKFDTTVRDLYKLQRLACVPVTEAMRTYVPSAPFGIDIFSSAPTDANMDGNFQKVREY